MGVSKFTKKLTKGTVRSLVITLVIASLLFIVGPGTALAVTPSATSSGTAYINSSIQFTVTVDIHSYEQIPINSIKVCARDAAGATSRWVTFGPGGTEITDSPTGYWSVSLASATAPGGYCNGYGYGYGWSDANFAGSTWGYIPCTGYGYMGTMGQESFGYKYGYGYGYTGYGGTYYPGTVSLVYTVTMNTTGMSAGSYNATVDVDAGTNGGGDAIHYFSETAHSFTLHSRGGGGGGGAPGPGINAGSISSSNVGSNSADVGWTTARPGTSQVEYWASPHEFSPENPSLVTEHLVHLTDLESDTTYSYKCRSKNTAGTLSVSGIHTFTTLAAAAEEEEEEEAAPEEAAPEEAAPPAPPAEEAPSETNWALIWGIIAAVVVIIVGIVVWQRRRAA